MTGSGVVAYEGDTTGALDLHAPGPVARSLEGGPISPEVWTLYATIVEKVYRTEFVKRAIRGNAPAALACVLYGHDLGLSPMVALREIDVVDGRPAPGANLVTARIRAEGHSLSWEYAHDSNGNEVACTARGRRADNGDTGEYTFTMQKAIRAGLAGKGAWKNYPESMLWARAVTQLARMLFADVFLGSVYTPEELGSVEGPVPEPQAAAITVTDGRGNVSQPGYVFEAGSGADVSSGGGPDEAARPHAAGTRADAAPPNDPSGAAVPEAAPAAVIPEEEAPAAGASSFTPGEPTFPGGTFKEWALPWLLDDVERENVILAIPDLDRALSRWDNHRVDAPGALATVAQCDNEPLLRLWADREARSRARKGVLSAIGQRLEALGGEPAVGAGDVGTSAGVGETEAAPPAAAEAFLPEGLLPHPLVRLRALLAFVKDTPSVVPNAKAWTEEGVLEGARRSGWANVDRVEDLDDDQLAAIWSVVPADARALIEGLSEEDLRALGAADWQQDDPESLQ